MRRDVDEGRVWIDRDVDRSSQAVGAERAPEVGFHARNHVLTRHLWSVARGDLQRRLAAGEGDPSQGLVRISNGKRGLGFVVRLLSQRYAKRACPTDEGDEPDNDAPAAQDREIIPERAFPWLVCHG